LFESPSLDLSVVIPAYNEELRLPVMLAESVDYLSKNFGQKFEIVVVDDGSRDRTTDVALVRKQLFSLLKASALYPNRIRSHDL
jgi:dolichyl-phosphate beta-glucosyltransferase